jgi:hypothetical protein
LKEKLRGAGSSKLMPQWVQARCWEKVIPSASAPSALSIPSAVPAAAAASFFDLAAPVRPEVFITSTSAVPPVRANAVSIDSVSRCRMPSRRMRRSTTTSMVCVS